MSIDDREGYRDEVLRRQALERRPDWAFRILVAVCLLVVLATAWKVRHKDRPAPIASPRVSVTPERRAPTPFEPSEQRSAIEPTPQPVINRCIVDGRVTYSGTVACSGTATAIRAPSVAPAEAPAGLTEYQREMLRSADARIARDAANASQETSSRYLAQPSGRVECDALAEEIRWIDSRSRQPNSGSEQDALRARRQAATSRRYDLRC